MRRKDLAAAAIILFSLVTPGLDAAPELVVHEWGTFTALQDESGKAIGGINSDDEPVPDFVYNLAPKLLFPPEEPPANSKGGIRRCHSQVTMRLETPVVYFYPNEEFSYPVTVAVSFRGGWLTQYYPKARAEAFGLRPDGTGMLTFGYGSLGWGISLSASNEGPSTNSLVWNTPRQVDSATVEAHGEHEKFLFYRGVGNIEAPVRVMRKEAEFIITRTRASDRPDEIHQLWLVDIHSDGTAAFRVLQPFTEETAFLVKTPSHLAPEEYSTDAVKDLKLAMRKALIEGGLFEKEADAMLNTWQASYFQSPGLRLFFLVPRKWTDGTLPLKVSIPRSDSRTPMPDVQPGVTRVMMGRIEIVTPEERAILKRIAGAGSRASAGKTWPDQAVPDDETWNELLQAYRGLGRFRNALLLDEQKRNPSPMLDRFIQRYQLQGYTPSFAEEPRGRPNVLMGP